MRIFLAGIESRRYIIKDMIDNQRKESCGKMQIFLAGSDTSKVNYILKNIDIVTLHPYILESFYAIKKDKRVQEMWPYYGDYLLDSGAYTFMNSGGNENWEAYIERYADFIVKNNIQKFFELDIDSIVGYDKVKEFRYRLERLTNRACIPVWHVSRGKDEFMRMCEEYSYVAIGGIVTKEITPDKYKYFSIFIKEAHKNKAKIHGLGFTNLALLKKYHFDSVDSTAWTTGNRFGGVYVFDGKSLRKHKRIDGYRISTPRELAKHNFLEWVKFQKYAETHL